jgi:hypothetical protein
MNLVAKLLYLLGLGVMGKYDSSLIILGGKVILGSKPWWMILCRDNLGVFI